ncbi:hypothetical protein ASZ78_007580 [Callipepla squamata]|uniref:Uncharacterized protein n=1 Tax=Callipepla squamata TaxID=9009 RepID=A0A226MBG7_CALSU|nr:hypothetical protein ASZ78_007580 [Callipepla squamata]
MSFVCTASFVARGGPPSAALRQAVTAASICPAPRRVNVSPSTSMSSDFQRGKSTRNLNQSHGATVAAMPASAVTDTAEKRQRERGPGSCSSAAPALHEAPIGAAPT